MRSLGHFSSKEDKNDSGMKERERERERNKEKEREREREYFSVI